MNTGTQQLEVVSDVAQLVLVLVQFERRTRHVVVFLHLIVERRVREACVGRIQQRTCIGSRSAS